MELSSDFQSLLNVAHELLYVLLLLKHFSDIYKRPSLIITEVTGPCRTFTEGSGKKTDCFQSTMAKQARSETEKQLCKDTIQLELQTVKKP